MELNCVLLWIRLTKVRLRMSSTDSAHGLGFLLNLSSRAPGVSCLGLNRIGITEASTIIADFQQVFSESLQTK